MSTDNGARLGQGNVIVTLGEEKIELKPTLFAAQVLNRQYGGFQDLLEKIAGFDLDVVTNVIIAGAGAAYNTTKARQRLSEQVFAAGLGGDNTDEVGLAASRYVMSLMRGGRPTPQQEETEAGPEEGNAKRAS